MNFIQASLPPVPLADNSVDSIITSSPYWRQRVYDIPDTIWGGEKDCVHAWSEYVIKGQTGGKSNKLNVKERDNYQAFPDQTQGVCLLCGAWKGQLGQEPDPDMFVEHMTEIGVELFRVLKPGGLFLLNIADTFAGSGGPGNQYKTLTGGKYNEIKTFKPAKVPQGMKPKDIVGIPWMVAQSFRESGWYWRGWMPWIKANCLPDSTTDRPGRDMEIIHIFAKSSTYYFDMEGGCDLLGLDRNLRFGDLVAIAIAGKGNKRNHLAPWAFNLAEFLITISTPPGGLVYDPFIGSGTTALAAKSLGRRCVGTDLGYSDIQRAILSTSVQVRMI